MAILDFAGGAALQAMSEWPRRRLAGIAINYRYQLVLLQIIDISYRYQLFNPLLVQIIVTSYC